MFTYLTIVSKGCGTTCYTQGQWPYSVRSKPGLPRGTQRPGARARMEAPPPFLDNTLDFRGSTRLVSFLFETGLFQNGSKSGRGKKWVGGLIKREKHVSKRLRGRLGARLGKHGWQMLLARCSSP